MSFTSEVLAPAEATELIPLTLTKRKKKKSTTEIDKNHRNSSFMKIIAEQKGNLSLLVDKGHCGALFLFLFGEENVTNISGNLLMICLRYWLPESYLPYLVRWAQNPTFKMCSNMKHVVPYLQMDEGIVIMYGSRLYGHEQSQALIALNILEMYGVSENNSISDKHIDKFSEIELFCAITCLLYPCMMRGGMNVDFIHPLCLDSYSIEEKREEGEYYLIERVNKHCDKVIANFAATIKDIDTQNAQKMTEFGNQLKTIIAQLRPDKEIVSPNEYTILRSDKVQIVGGMRLKRKPAILRRVI